MSVFLKLGFKLEVNYANAFLIQLPFDDIHIARVSDCVFDMSRCMDSGKICYNQSATLSKHILQCPWVYLPSTMQHSQGPKCNNSSILWRVSFMAGGCQLIQGSAPTSVIGPEATQRADKWSRMSQVHINHEGLWDIKETQDWPCLRRVVAKGMAQ